MLFLVQALLDGAQVAQQAIGGGWAEFVRAEKRKREQKPEEAMQEALEPVVSKPRKTITMASLIGKKAAEELAPFDSSAAVAISRRRKRQRDDELLLLM